MSNALDLDGKRYPRLTLHVSNPQQPDLAVDTQAYLDSGAERSLFSGWIGVAIGIDVLSGRQLSYETTVGSHLTATVHPIRLSHPELGEFDLEAGFSSVEIKRNLLGRDFFNLIQIGFRERHLRFFITPTP